MKKSLVSILLEEYESIEEAKDGSSYGEETPKSVSEVKIKNNKLTPQDLKKLDDEEQLQARLPQQAKKTISWKLLKFLSTHTTGLEYMKLVNLLWEYAGKKEKFDTRLNRGWWSTNLSVLRDLWMYKDGTKWKINPAIDVNKITRVFPVQFKSGMFLYRPEEAKKIEMHVNKALSGDKTIEDYLQFAPQKIKEVFEGKIASSENKTGYRDKQEV